MQLFVEDKNNSINSPKVFSQFESVCQTQCTHYSNKSEKELGNEFISIIW